MKASVLKLFVGKRVNINSKFDCTLISINEQDNIIILRYTNYDNKNGSSFIDCAGINNVSILDEEFGFKNIRPLLEDFDSETFEEKLKLYKAFE